MQELIIDKTLVFRFNDSCVVSKCDEWKYYEKFMRTEGLTKRGVKCVDLVILDNENNL